MALQIWLPLNGDLKNYGVYSGLKEVSVSSSVNSNDNGLWDKCYKNTSSSGSAVSNTINLSFSKFTICTWMKVDTISASYRYGLSLENDNNERISFASVINTAGAIGSMVYRNVSGTSTLEFNMAASKLAAGEWVHYMISYDGNKYYIYQNGVFITTRTPTDKNATFNMTKLYLFGQGNSQGCFEGYLNDVRVYDEVLSLKQIQQVSSALVLHYKLTAPFDTNPNLITNGSPNNSLSGWSYAGNGWINSLVDCAQAPCGKAVRCTYTQSGSTPVQGGTHHQPTDYSSLTNGGTYTVSCYVRASKNCVVKFKNEMFSSETNFNVTTTFKRLVATGTVNTSSTYHSNIIYVTADTAENGMWIEAYGFKLEQGSVATGFIDEATNNSTIEYDCSGYGYNGTKTGTLTYDTDTARYATAMKTTTSSYILTDGLGPHPKDAITVAAWIKTATNAQIGNWEGGGAGIQYINGTKWQFSVYAGGAYRTPQFTLATGSWNHVVGTYSAGVAKLYIDGVLKATTTFTGDNYGITYHASTPWCVNGNPNGSRAVSDLAATSFSDFRIYATALSAEQVKELYSNSAFIDSKDNLFGYEFQEGSN